MVDQDNAAKALEAKLIAEKISQEFTELNQDILEIIQKNPDPVLIATLLFKLSQEREQTNKELQKIHEKFDTIMLELKTRNSSQAEEMQTSSDGRKFTILPEQDQKIMQTIEQKGPTSAFEIQQIMGYTGLNAASQRLNGLFKQGLLKKIQSGKKVLYFSP
ncbi:MAG: hypothetical protein Q7R70_01600 [Candidatus Diapherotrites archaeon]|nr:hypothetical protein [Candidatus Diapherotrites archaeon]